MSDTIQIQLGSSKNVNAINVDQSINMGLNASPKELLSYNESSVIDVSNLFDAERQESEVYRVYGRIDFMSIINGLKKQYKVISDFFTPPRLGDELSGATKNLLTSFDIYLCYPSTGNTVVSTETIIRDYVVVSKLENVEVFKAGFSRNLFFNYVYSFDFNIDFNVEGYLDSFGKPIDKFYLFFNYRPSVNGNFVAETVKRKVFGSSPISLPYQTYNIGDVITGDFVNYVNTNFQEELIEEMEYYVTFPYDINSLQFKYQPFIPIKVRDFNDEIVSANISGGTESDLTIPYYAIKIDNDGNVIWKDILVNGYIDPISGNGVDYPFINKRHYIFNTIVLPLKPDLTHGNTNTVFTEIKFGGNNTLYNKPSSSLNSLGDKC